MNVNHITKWLTSLVVLNFRIPIWYTVKFIFTIWLVLPQFRGAAYIYDRFVRQHIKQNTGRKVHFHY